MWQLADSSWPADTAEVFSLFAIFSLYVLTSSELGKHCAGVSCQLREDLELLVCSSSGKREELHALLNKEI